MFFFFYLFNQGKLPTRAKDGISSNEESMDIFKKVDEYIKSVTARTFGQDMENIFEKYLPKANTSYNMIIKCEKGFKISYFSGELAYKLGYSSNNIMLVGEDLDILFPKEIAKAHRMAMINYLITNNSFSYKTKKYLFNSEKQLISCLLEAYAIPALTKHLNILVNIEIQKHKRDLSFIMNGDYDVIAMSKFLAKHYALSLKMLSKFETDLLDIFDISKDILNISFKSEIKKIIEVQRYLNLLTEVIFSKWLFHTKLTENDIISLKKSELFELLGKLNKISEKEFKALKEDIGSLYNVANEEIKSNKLTEFKEKKFVIIKKKEDIMQNIFKFLGKVTEYEFYDENIKKITETMLSFKKTVHRSESGPFNKLNDKSRNNLLHIKIYLRSLFGVPLFIVKIKEDKQNVIGKAELMHQTFIINNLNQNKKTLGRKGNRNSNIVGPNISQSSILILGNYNKIGQNKSNKLAMSKAEKESIQKLRQTKSFELISHDSLLIFGLFITLFASISLTFVLFFYQRQILSYTHSLFTCFLSNLKQNSDLLNIYNTALTIIYNEAEITNSSQYNITLSEYFSKLKENVESFEESYHSFYLSVLNSKIPLEKGVLRTKLNFNKFKIYWQVGKFESNFIDEVYYLIYLGYQSSQEVESIDKINNDMLKLFFDNYTNNPEDEVQTNFIRLIFYLKENTFPIFEKLFSDFSNDIIYSFSNYYDQSKVKYILLEISGVCVYIIFLSLVLIFLFKNNKIILENIILMFLTTHINSSFEVEKLDIKYHWENIYFRQKLKSFVSLLKSFQLTNLQKFNSIKPIDFKAYDSINGKSGALTFENSTQSQALISPNSFISPNMNITDNKMNTTNSLFFKKLNKEPIKLFSLKLENTPVGQMKSGFLKKQQKLSQVKDTSEIENSTNYLQTNDKPSKSLSISKVMELFTKTWINIIKTLILLLVIFFCVIIVFFVLKTFFTLKFLKDTKQISDDFSIYIKGYSNLFLSFNFLRSIMISVYSDDSLKEFEEMLEDIRESTKKVEKLNMNSFPAIKGIIHSIETNNIDTEGLAGSFFESGVSAATNAVCLIVENIEKDYKKLSLQENKLEQIQKLIRDNNSKYSMTLAEIALTYIYSNLKSELFSAFEMDINSIKSAFSIKVTVLNLFCFLYCVLLFLIVSYCVIIYIHHRLQLIKMGVRQFGKTMNFWLILGNCSNQDELMPLKST